MQREHLFLIDPLESLNLQLDSSLRLMAALARRGHKIHVAEPRQLQWRHGAKAAEANSRELAFLGDATHFSAAKPAFRTLDGYDAIHMRKDPPYDMDYIATTWLLDEAGPKTRVYNAPHALRRYNEKLAILRFPDAIKPGIVSADPAELARFVETECNGDGVLKPLTLFGGRGVMRLKGPNMAETLRQETDGGRALRLVQPFDPAIFNGEVRAFTAFGEPIAWCLKTPSAGNFLANTRAGATLAKYEPKPEELARITKIAKTLLQDGVAFIGFDVIGGYVSEINLTSPRLLAGPGDEADHYGRIAELVEKDLAPR